MIITTHLQSIHMSFTFCSYSQSSNFYQNLNEKVIFILVLLIKIQINLLNCIYFLQYVNVNLVILKIMSLNQRVIILHQY